MADFSPFVSICILNYNGKHYLEACINSIYDIDYPKDRFEIVVVDNASSDGSVEFLKNKFPSVRIFEFSENLGFSGGYNRAINQINNEYIVLLNVDTKVTKNWLSELVKPANQKDIAACGSKMLFYDHPDLINHAGGQITIAGFGYDIDFGKKDECKINNPKYISTACGGAMLIKKSIFKEVGEFDSAYFMYFEDVDLCWRFWLYGYKILYTPSSIVLHKYSGVMGSESPQKIYLTQRNHFFNIIKNFELHNVFLALIISLGSDLFKIVVFCKKMCFVNIIFLLKGNLDFLKALPIMIKKRKEIQSRRRLKDRELISNGIIAPLFRSYKEYQKLRNLKIEKYRKK